MGRRIRYFCQDFLRHCTASYHKKACLMRSIAFDPVASPQSRLLILGTLPGIASLKLREYYAHPRNSFWWIMGQLIGAGPELSYADRLGKLIENRIALWDVCQSAVRPGSSDSNIELDSVAPNNFTAFFSAHPKIEKICFNGYPAEKLFGRLVRPTLAADREAIGWQVLPSTSPANARLAREEKLKRWRAALADVVA